MVRKLVEGYKGGSAVPTNTLDNYDFYVMPIINPDGKLGLVLYFV